MAEWDGAATGGAGGAKPEALSRVGGLAGWLLARWRHRSRTRPRLTLVEKIYLAPRQTLCLVEAEGCRFLVASSPEGSPAFYALESRAHMLPARNRRRISW